MSSNSEMVVSTMFGPVNFEVDRQLNASQPVPTSANLGL